MSTMSDHLVYLVVKGFLIIDQQVCFPDHHRDANFKSGVVCSDKPLTGKQKDNNKSDNGNSSTKNMFLWDLHLV